MNVSVKEYDAIMAVMNTYMKGANKNGAETKKAFHKNALVNAEPAQVLFDTIDQLGETNGVGRVDILDVVGDMACVRVTLENWHGKNYVDFHQLRKSEGGWKIVSKMYTEV